MKEYSVLKIYSKELEKEKRIYIYLPKNYYKSDEFYPVLYMHDGQNLFDDTTAYHHTSWNIMDVYETYSNLPEVIIVGIESDEDRTDELVPYEIAMEDNTLAGGKADLYLKFITTTVKPYIDKRFRTFKSSKNTGIMGSSFGGVNAMYAALVFGEYFTRFGCISNAFYYDGLYKELKELAESSTLHNVKKLYMDTGTNETNDQKIDELYIETNKEVYDVLKEKLNEDTLKFNLIDGAMHTERDWGKRFPEIIRFLFQD